MATHLWTWNGHYFGYREGNDLWTYAGVLAGHFHGDEVYGANGHYLGEVNGDRLLSNISKASQRQTPFGARHGAAVAARAGLGSRGMIGGFKEFPKPEEFV
jgi:hypothetical protein